MRRILFSVVGLGNCILCLFGCATAPSLKSAKVDYAQDLTMAMASGKIVMQEYHSESVVRNYDADQVVKDKIEVIDFTVKNDFKPSNGQSPEIVAEVTTTRKVGDGEMHDLAFPNLGETIPFVFSPQGNVKKAGAFDASSLFYVPPISLPDDPVKVGDTWTMNHKWLSSKAQLPMEISVVTILKDFLQCEGALCAELEVSGHVTIMGLKQGEVKFNSEIRGTILFGMDIGQPVWLDLASEESFSSKDRRVQISSCLVSVTTDPLRLKGIENKKLDCDPKQTEPLRAAHYAKTLVSAKR